jgi:hypothetical protein
LLLKKTEKMRMTSKNRWTCETAKKVLAIGMVYIIPGGAGAFNVVITDPNVTHSASAGNFITQLDPNPYTPLAAGATQAIRDLYQSDYPDFTYVAGAARTGTLTISQLDAFQDGNQGGLDIVASFAGESSPHIYRWIQYIETDSLSPSFRGATTSPFTDPPPLDRDDDLPFYETNAERTTEGVGYVTGGDFYENPRFWDAPRVNDFRAPVTVRLNLFLTDMDSANNTVTIYDGVQYGLHITPVPEPEAWAMMIAGLGLVGWRLRRGRADYSRFG